MIIFSLALELFQSDHPKDAPIPPPEPVSMERLKTHVARVKDIIALFGFIGRYPNVDAIPVLLMPK